MTVLVSELRDAVMYPASMTEGVAMFADYGGHLRFAYYEITPRIDDDMLTLVQPLYRVQRGETFRVEYTEVFNGYTLADNTGTSCVTVDFLLLSCGEDWNLPSHNCSDAPVAEYDVRDSVEEVLVQ